MGKVKALAAAGVVEGIPAEILDAQGGELYALAVVGAFVGCDTTAGIEMRKAMLASKMDERMLVVLDEMGAMLDSESETDVKQLQYNALRRSINKIPILGPVHAAVHHRVCHGRRRRTPQLHPLSHRRR